MLIICVMRYARIYKLQISGPIVHSYTVSEMRIEATILSGTTTVQEIILVSSGDDSYSLWEEWNEILNSILIVY